VATFAVTDTTSQVVTYTATDTSQGDLSIFETPTVTFFPSVSATASTVSASLTSVSDDGTSTSTNTVTHLDSSGNPVSGQTVTLGQGTGTSVISGGSTGVTNALGVVTFTVTNTTSQVVTYTATDITQGGLAVTQTSTVTFAGLPSPVSATGTPSSTGPVTTGNAGGPPPGTSVPSSGPGRRTLTKRGGSGSAGHKLSLGAESTVVPGESATVTGTGCNSDARVTLTINGASVGSTTASAQGAFSTNISPPTLYAGQYVLKASCGPTLATTLAMVVSSSNSTSEGSAAVFAVFVVLGLVLLGGQYNSNATRRRRRRPLSDEFEDDELIA
jgi:hypothetical protein